MVKNKTLDELTICEFTNIADFDFTAELGAMFGGRPFFVEKGGSLLMPEPAAYRLAVNLAKAMLNSRIVDTQKGTGDDRSAIPAWGEEKIDELVEKILSRKIFEQRKPVLTDVDRIAEKIKELNEPDIEIDHVDKADVIAKLEELGEKVDRRKSLSELKKQLEAYAS